MFQINFTPSALDDIRWYPKRDRITILDHTEEQLAHEPNIETRNRKRPRPNLVAEWELRIGRFRVFYDVDAAMNSVEVKVVARKVGSSLLVRGKEFSL